VEHTVGAFTFGLNTDTPKPSFFDGKQLSSEVIEVWKQRGYVQGGQFVEDGAFSPASTWRLTLNGSLKGDVSFWLEVLNALTLTLAPYRVTQQYDLQLVLEDVRAGKVYEAKVQESEQTWVEGLLILALPFSQRGHHAAVERMAEHLYDQLSRQQGSNKEIADGFLQTPQRGTAGVR
jgi:hypothetical protein